MILLRVRWYEPLTLFLLKHEMAIHRYHKFVWDLYIESVLIYYTYRVYSVQFQLLHSSIFSLFLYDFPFLLYLQYKDGEMIILNVSQRLNYPLRRPSKLQAWNILKKTWEKICTKLTKKNPIFSVINFSAILNT